MGKLNLLHHKSWHVYSEANRKRVKEDEQKAQAIQDAKDAQEQESQRQSRLAQLRHSKEPHFTLFPEVSQPNEEYVAEKAAARAKAEAPFVMKLGESKEGKKESVWYGAKDFRAAADAIAPPSAPFAKEASHDKRRIKDLQSKERQDPLTFMKEMLKDTASGPSKQKSAPKESLSKKSSKSIEQLRAERMQREAEEKKKADALLHPSKPTDTLTHQQHEQDARYYHSQFNPDATRRHNRQKEKEPVRPWQSHSNRYKPYQ